MYGDTTRGVESCGEVYKNEDEDDVIGDLCTVQAMENGSIKASLQLRKTFLFGISSEELCVSKRWLLMEIKKACVWRQCSPEAPGWVRT